MDTEAKTIAGSVKINLANTGRDIWSQLCFGDYISAIGQTFDKLSGLRSALASEFTGIYEVSSAAPLEYSGTEENPSVLFVTLDTPLGSGESIQILR